MAVFDSMYCDKAACDHPLFTGALNTLGLPFHASYAIVSKFFVDAIPAVAMLAQIGAHRPSRYEV
jgi:hypothetical protein